MPNDVSCPDDPNEVVTRKILADELAKFRVEMSAELAKQALAITESNRLDLAQQARVLEENLRSQMVALFEQHSTKAQSQMNALFEEHSTKAQSQMNALFEEHSAKTQLEDHESRIVRLEARPANRARKPKTPQPSRKPKATRGT